MSLKESKKIWKTLEERIRKNPKGGMKLKASDRI